jgi:hypothetical protein
MKLDLRTLRLQTETSLFSIIGCVSVPNNSPETDPKCLEEQSLMPFLCVTIGPSLEF